VRVAHLGDAFFDDVATAVRPRRGVGVAMLAHRVTAGKPAGGAGVALDGVLARAEALER